MKNAIKRGIALALSLLTLLAFFAVPISRVSAATTYNNTTSVTMNTSISSAGLLNTSLHVSGKSGITSKIHVELYVEKRILGIFWSRVDIGTPDNIWTDSITGCTYNNTFSTQLNSTGTFRVTAEFTVYGSGGAADIIDKENTASY